MELSMDLIAQIATVLFGVLSAVFGVKFKKVAKRFKYAVGLMDYVVKAFEDGSLSVEEAKGIRLRVKMLLRGKPHAKDQKTK
jgi:hypothetical protein